ncbi:uncharacterized protein TNCV_2453081 [Trichonephila clavipes]|nr:uncharacterized protein TNCV_2453081 [Trichonephila clavipes]
MPKSHRGTQEEKSFVKEKRRKLTSSPVEKRDYDSHKNAHKDFQKRFVDNPFGQGFSICDRLWFRDDLRTPVAEHKNILLVITLKDSKACYDCRQSLSRKSIPNLSKYNGFVYPEIPAHLPTLDLVSERIISSRISFTRIRRLRHVHGQFGILGQIINVPVSINTMVNRLPRNVDDDYCVNVHIKRRKIHKTSYLMGLITKKNHQNMVAIFSSNSMVQNV